jgi:hypothetical protein
VVAEARHEAELFARLIRRGELTLEEARKDLLISPRQLRNLWEIEGLNVPGIVLQRQLTWRELQRLLAVDTPAGCSAR